MAQQASHRCPEDRAPDCGADSSSSAADFNPSAAELSTSAADLSPSAADLSTSAADLSPSTAELSTSAADLSPRTAAAEPGAAEAPARPPGAWGGRPRRPIAGPGRASSALAMTAPAARRRGPTLSRREGALLPLFPLLLLASVCLIVSPAASSAVHVSSRRGLVRGLERGDGHGRRGGEQGRRELLESPCAALDAKLKKAPRASAQASVAFVRPSDVGPCARARYSLKPTAAEDLDSLIKYFQSFYAILNLAKKSPDPLLPSSYDILGALQALKTKTKTFKYEDEFYRAIVAAVDRLNDGHTSLTYVSTVPTVFRLALNLVGVVENGKPVVRVAPAALTGTAYPSMAGKAPFRFNSAAYYNARVLKIENKPAWAFFSEWARTQPGDYHSPGQRLNDAFAHLAPAAFRVSYDAGRFSSRLANPGQDFVAMVVQRPGSRKQESIRVPWLAAVDTSAGPFAPRRSAVEAVTPPAAALAPRPNGLDGEWALRDGTRSERGLRDGMGGGRAVRDGSAQQWLPQGDTGGSPATSSSSDGLRLLHPERALLGQSQGQQQSQAPGQASRLALQRPHLMRRQPRVPSKFQLDQPSPLRGPTLRNAAAGGATLISSPRADMWLVYKLNDGKTGVLVVSTFDVEDGNGNPAYDTFVKETQRAFNTLIKHGCTRVIIDLTGNPGGYVQFGTWFITLLMGTQAASKPGKLFGFDKWRFLSQTKLVDALVQDRNGAFDGTQYADPNTGKGFTAATSTRFFFPTQALAFVKGVKGVYSKAFRSQQTSLESFLGVPSVAPGLGARKIVLLSDGLCFSTCNTVASTLKRAFGVPLVTVGGLPGSKLPFAGGGGGFVTGNAESDIVDQFSESIAARKDAPKRFKGRITLSMRLAAGLFGPKAASSVEFTALQPDLQVKYTATNVASPGLIYEEAAKIFKRD